MRIARLFASLAASLSVPLAVQAADLAAVETPADKPEKRAEPPKTGASVPGEGSDARIRIKLPAEVEP